MKLFLKTLTSNLQKTYLPKSILRNLYICVFLSNQKIMFLNVITIHYLIARRITFIKLKQCPILLIFYQVFSYLYIAYVKYKRNHNYILDD